MMPRVFSHRQHLLTIIPDAGRELPGLQLSIPACVGGRRGELLVSVCRFRAYERVDECRIRTLTVRQVETVRETIMDLLPNTVRLRELADAVGYSPAHFSRVFRATLGQTFRAYVLSIRIRRAMKLMEDPELKICEVSMLVGFCSPSTFSRVFTRSVGLSPFRWRNQKRDVSTTSVVVPFFRSQPSRNCM